MAHKRVQEIRQFDCPQCTGRGFVATNHGYEKCTAAGCVNGQVKKIINVIVHDEKVTTNG